uniref:Solute carrier family 49 member 4 n=1 Tax=Acanthochromis polyacanthus TaxID=80966 RepID=A0A3Q1HEV5_9TELE
DGTRNGVQERWRSTYGVFLHFPDQILCLPGLRASLLLSAFFMLLGSALRSIPLTDQPLRRWLIHGGQFLNGLAGPTIMSAGPFLSTTWFAPDQRATATAVASLFSYLGGAASFVVGPLVVPPPNDTQAGTTMTAAILDNSIRDRIQLVLYTELAAIVVLFAAVLLYFPSRPPMPPSVAAASQRLSYRNSICRLLSNLRFLMIAVAYAVPTGVMAGWSGVLDMVLTPAKVSQVDAGWIGFWSTVGGCVFGVAMASKLENVPYSQLNVANFTLYSQCRVVRIRWYKNTYRITSCDTFFIFI